MTSSCVWIELKLWMYICSVLIEDDFRIVVGTSISQTTRTIGSVSIKHRSDVKVSGRYLMMSIRSLCSTYGVFVGLPQCQWSITYNDVIMGAMAPQITSLTIVYSIVNSGADQRIYQSSAYLVFVWGIHRWPVNSPHKWAVTRKMFPFDDVIMRSVCIILECTV